MLAAYLAERGYPAEVRRFRAPRTYGWELLVIGLLLGLGGVQPQPWLALLGAYWFWAYFDGWGTPWDALFAPHVSHNLLARAGRGDRRIVLLAHYDTAKTFFLYHPRRVHGFRRTFVLQAVLATALPLLAAASPLLSRPVGLFFLLQAALLWHREWTAPYVNGANDNASGVAVAVQLFLDTAPRLPPGVELWLALTGSEEVGARGARALLKDLPPPRDTLVLNIDNVGRGQLHYAEAEGMLRLHRSSGALVDAARRLDGAVPVQYRLAYFDTLPLVRAGYRCLTLVRLERGVPPHWHWPTDTLDNVDPQAVEQTLAYARTLLWTVLPPPR